MNRRRIRILLVDASPQFLDAVTRILESSAEVEIVGRVASSSEALALSALLRPDLVVMDLDTPAIGGLETTRRLAARPGAPWIILMSLDDKPGYRLAAEASGADGFLPKSQLRQRLLPLIRSLRPDNTRDQDALPDSA